MKPRGTRVATFVLFSLVVFAFLFFFVSRRLHFGRQLDLDRAAHTKQQSDSVGPTVPNTIPPLQNPRGPEKRSLRTGLSQSVQTDAALPYDESLSFEINLRRLKEFCELYSKDPQLTVLLGPFVKVLFEHAKGQFPEIKRALDEPAGTAIFRNLLLASAIASDASLADKANLVWKMALDPNEPVGVRRVATHLTREVDDGQRRTESLYTLLRDPDSDILIYALGNSARHMDERSYNLIKTTLLDSTDINVRVAAVNAIGNAPFADNQTTLIELLSKLKSSRNDAFSFDSLPKRTAIPHLDMQNPQTYQLVKGIALDDNEDPGVRAKAISQFTPRLFPDATPMLLQLLQKLDSDNAVPLRAVTDALLTAPTPEIIQAIRDRAEQLSDPQVRAFIIKRLEPTINRGAP